MPGEQSVHSDEASNFRKILEKSTPDTTFSFRSELLSDVDSHKARKAKSHRSSSHRRHRSHRDRDRGPDTTALDPIALETRQLSRLLAQDEYEAVDMRQVLYKTSERLEKETQRANNADLRAREAEARALALQAARETAQAQVLREQATLKAYQVQLETARNEILRAQKELDSMAADRERAEEEAARDRSKARAIAKELEVQQAIELGRQEGKNQGFIDGRKEGWYIGTRDGRKEALKEMMYYDDMGSVTSQSSTTPPMTSSGHQPQVASVASTTTRSVPPPPPARVELPTPVNVSQNIPQNATSTRTATPQATHKRSGSLTQNLKARLRGNSDPKPPPATRGPVPNGAPAPTVADLTRPVQLTPSISQERMRISSPISRQQAPSSPRHPSTSPLPSGFIPLQDEDGRVSLPPPHELDPPPPSPHSPAAPLPPEIPYTSPGRQSLQAPHSAVSMAPTITVQEPTPPEPAERPLTMPEPHPAPAPGTTRTMAENNVKPSRVLARDYAFGARTESPPLPPLPNERPNKGKGRQRMGTSRGGTGLNAPGRTSPSDTSTEFSQFEMLEQPERVPIFSRGNGSKLSVIMEGGSTAAESPEPTPIGVGRPVTPRMGGMSPLRGGMPGVGPPSPSQGILNDPREYGDFPESQLSPDQLAQRRAIAEQLRFGSPSGNSDSRRGNGGRNAPRDDVSIRSSTTRTSAPPSRRPPNPKMPERLGASRAVEVLEKQAEMYDAFGTGRFPSFESQSSPSPDDVVSTRTPDFRKGHRRAASSATTVPEITIQPPSRPSSKGSRLSAAGNFLSPEQGQVSLPTPATPSRRHTMQGPPMTPSRVPLPHTTGRVPMSLDDHGPGDFTLPAGFVPTGGPPEVLEAFSSALPSRTPNANVGGLPSRTPRFNGSGLPPQGGSFNFPGHTPSGVPLPLSTATTAHVLPDSASSAPRGSAQTSHHELPSMATPSYEPAAIPPGFKWPPGFTPARVPLPESAAGTPRSAYHQTPWSGAMHLGAGATPGPSRPVSLGADRPMALYAGDGGPNKKVSSLSLASSFKKFDPSTYVDPAYIASAESTFRGDPDDDKRAQDKVPTPRPISMRSPGDKMKRKSQHAASIETVTDEDDPPRTPRV